MKIQWDLMEFHEGLVGFNGISWNFMRVQWDVKNCMRIQVDLMEFREGLVGFNGFHEGLVGFKGIS